MKRIIIHWTAGRNIPNETDKEHYHFMIDHQGKIYRGDHKPEANENCNDGDYAAHCGGGNTGSIGVALCGMMGFKDSNHIGVFPLTKTQSELTFELVAKLCKQYNISVTSQTVLTHKEFGDSHPTTSSYGKIDICYLPPYPTIEPDKIGDFIRSKVSWYLQRLE